MQITQPSQYRYAKLQYRFAVTSGSPSIGMMLYFQGYTVVETTGKTLNIFKFNYLFKQKIFYYCSANAVDRKLGAGIRGANGGSFIRNQTRDPL